MKHVTEAEFLKRIQDIHKGRYLYKSGYKNTNTKVKMFCTSCNKEFYSKPAKLFIGQGCPYCRAERIGDKLRLTNTSFLGRVNQILGNDYQVLSEYKGLTKKVTIKHNTCGNTYSIVATSILNKQKTCPYCKQLEVNHSGFTYSADEINQKIFDLVADEYTILSEYKNAKTKMLFRHNTCGHQFWMVPQKFILDGQRCPDCYHSRGEDKVLNYLEKNTDYIIKQQFKFKDLYYKAEHSPLRFDFALLDQDNNLCYLIEYDGIQHYELGHWNTAERFKETQERDKLKDEYCKNHNLKLIRISYKDYYNVDKILAQELL